MKPSDHTPAQVSVFAPGTVSNLGPGFDVLGLALQVPGDVVTVGREGEPGSMVVSVTGGGGRIPSDPERNSASAAARAVLARLGTDAGLRVHVTKGLPLAAGLGGSAASAVAGAVATDLLFGGGLTSEDLLRAAVEGEAAGSGAAHADNAAPALLGGLVLVLPGEPLTWTRIPTPADMYVAIAHPDLEVETRGARDLLPRTLDVGTAVRQWGNAAGFVAACYQGDWDLLRRCGVDAFAEGVRKNLVSGFDGVVASAVQAGAATSGLSGSGPSVFALCRGEETAERVAAAMSAAFEAEGVASQTFVSMVATEGARPVSAAR
ncbi:MAG: homoserine kinase [Gemmatimonadetes bacterium]|nr:homoserine kinase [Gemmatimonadota bacterium]